MLNQKQMEQFAELAVRVGANMQPGQTVVVRCDVACQEFAHLIVAKAYEFGAKKVIMQWSDEIVSRMGMLNQSVESLCEVPQWAIDQSQYFIDQKVCLISIKAGDPNIYKGCDPVKLKESALASGKAMINFRKATMSNLLRWTLVSIPTPAWAQQVFPGIPAEEAVDKMWDAIGHIMRLDREDPTEAWFAHIDVLTRRAAYLTSHNFETIHMYNAQGTDLYVGLAIEHEWIAAREMGQDGIPFTANMPTEEIFTAPHNKKINGTVVSALPLVNNGNIIDNFSITFKDGRVVDYTAEVGYEALKGLLTADEGVLSLGEIALIGKNSPIAESGILFFNTLFDENASCHLAFGQSYPTTVKNGNSLTDEQLAERGMNSSIKHVDFMVGTADLSITATTESGEEITVFVDGNWVI